MESRDRKEKFINPGKKKAWRDRNNMQKESSKTKEGRKEARLRKELKR